MQPDIRRFLYDIQLACEALIEFTGDRSLDNYQDDLLLRSGVERQIEIIGEALNQASKIDPTLAEEINGFGRSLIFAMSSYMAMPVLRMRLFGVFCETTCPRFMSRFVNYSTKKTIGRQQK